MTDNYDPYDQRSWPPCEACGRRQVHRSGCPAITVAVGALAATAAALVALGHAAMGLR